MAAFSPTVPLHENMTNHISTLIIIIGVPTQNKFPRFSMQISGTEIHKTNKTSSHELCL